MTFSKCHHTLLDTKSSLSTAIICYVSFSHDSNSSCLLPSFVISQASIKNYNISIIARDVLISKNMSHVTPFGVLLKGVASWCKRKKCKRIEACSLATTSEKQSSRLPQNLFNFYALPFLFFVLDTSVNMNANIKSCALNNHIYIILDCRHLNSFNSKSISVIFSAY